MLIDVMELQEAALRGRYGSIPIRMSCDDPTLTYEQVILYTMCRCSGCLSVIDPDEDFAGWKKTGLLDNKWLKLKAAKTHPMVIEHPWDEIFPEYKQYMEEKAKRELDEKTDAGESQ